ncbi:MAG: methyltransferase domain-containing protein, partial [Pseudomonadota bacterium]
MRLLADILPEAHWLVGNSRSFEDFWRSQEAVAGSLTGLVVLLHSPFVFPGKDCLKRLIAAHADSGAPVVLPVDPRGWGGETAMHYATLHGFERFTVRLAQEGRQLLPYDGRAPLLQLMAAERLRQAGPEEWESILTPPATALLVSDAFVHPYADYYGGNRAEVLGLVPADTGRLLDVGGGEGRFAALVKNKRGCVVHVAELNPDAAAVAETHADRVWLGDFLSLDIDERYDCITLLDVVEHALDPAGMLRRAGELLAPAGTI